MGQIREYASLNRILQVNLVVVAFYLIMSYNILIAIVLNWYFVI